VSGSERIESELERAIDAALARALMPPAPPIGLRARVQAALARGADAELWTVRARIEREQREQLAELERSYVRVRRRTLATLIGAAFASGIAVALLLPWLTLRFGSYTPLVLASGGAVAGLVLAAAILRERRSLQF
jgi:hypothetical protein